jgi:uncharacterized protein
MQRFFQHAFVRLVLIVVPSIILGSIISNIVSAGFHNLNVAASETITNAVFGISVLLVAMIVEWFTVHRTLVSLGLSLKTALRDLLVGFGVGGVLFTVVFTMLLVSGNYHLDTRVGAGAFGSITGSLVLWLAVAFFEEILFRGTVFHLVEEGAGSVIAIVLTSLFFGFAHLFNPGATIVSTLAITLEAGVLLASLYMLTRSLWIPIGVHWAWNFFEGSLFGSPVSGNMGLPTLWHSQPQGSSVITGGAFGPEAGLFTVILISIVGGIVIWRCAQTGKIIRSPWQHATTVSLADKK